MVGLFVKNLENVQGDERDIILMSVCYGPDPDGRMVMNFGPINQEGGEKRLNVIFSRARVHMAIVSSIDPEAITNTYNDGANTLRRFLEYASAESTGDIARAGAALATFRDRRSAPSAGRPSSVATQLAAALRERGLLVVEGVGQSGFRVDLAVRRADDHEHRVAVLLDRPDATALQPASERLLGHPGVLMATGWRVVHVPSKDWYDAPGSVVERVDRAVRTNDADQFLLTSAAVRQEVDQAVAAGLAAAPMLASNGAWGSAAPDTGPTSPKPGPSPVEMHAMDESLKGRSVCFTGGSVCSIRGVRMSRDDQERLATAAGLDVRQSVSARLDILVLANPDSRSSKAERAAQLGVRRIAEPAFWRMAGVDVDPPREG